ncbi:hypothetical protein [Lacticaseibacillus salsurivasis]|uniref:hypothetical protein n=1 Tax=Lacticaseibacillus salsurivasis TaxID=3081441 RepID=UPI0030C729B9
MPESAQELTLVAQSTAIGNRHIALSYKEGHLILTELDSGKQYRDFLSVEDCGDEGDTYDYLPAQQDWIHDLDFSSAKAVLRH